MPPELKKTIESLSEMTCENCIYSDSHWQTDTVKCRKDLDSELGDFAKISHANFFCSHGSWVVEIAQARTSTASFDVAYDCLKEK